MDHGSKQNLNVENTIELEAFHLNISTDLEWLWCHSPPYILHQGILNLRGDSRHNFSHL